MNSTENRSAAAFFANLLLPLRRANARRNINYLDRGAKRHSYWGEVISRTGGVEKLSEAACDAQALLSLLGSYWVQNREPYLPELLPHLERLHRELSGSGLSSEPSGRELTEFVYPIF